MAQEALNIAWSFARNISLTFWPYAEPISKMLSPAINFSELNKIASQDDMYKLGLEEGNEKKWKELIEKGFSPLDIEIKKVNVSAVKRIVELGGKMTPNSLRLARNSGNQEMITFIESINSMKVLSCVSRNNFFPPETIVNIVSLMGTDPNKIKHDETLRKIASGITK